MPEKLEKCVDALMADPDFKPRKKGQSKKDAAYAVCTAQQKADTTGLDTDHCICPNPECGNETPASTSCEEQHCPDCDAQMIPKERKSFNMRITKATMRDGRMYWQAAISDNRWDKQDERLALSIFDDFKYRIDKARQESGDDYMPPFVSLSHYDRLEDRSGELGEIKDVWTQRKYFKADGWFHDNRLGQRAFAVIRNELKRQSAGEEIEDPVRLSIGFYPRKTAQEDGKLVFLSGVLDHIALTRVPVNPRTGFTHAMEIKSMTTKKDDALSILGEDYTEDIEELEMQQRAKADVGMVIKGDDCIDCDSPITEEQDICLRAMLDEDLEEKAWTYAYKRSLPDSAYAWVEKGEGCSKEDGKTPQKCRHLPFKTTEGSVDCAHVRAALQAIGGARTGKKMKGVPASAKAKLQRALKGCQKGKAEVLEVELTEYEQGRIDGYNDALDMYAQPPEEEVIEMSENEINAEAIKLLEDSPPEEEKSEVVVDPLDTATAMLKEIVNGDGSRTEKAKAAEATLQQMAALCQKAINNTTPATAEDIAASYAAQLEKSLAPIVDEIAVLKEAVKSQAVRESAPSHALQFTSLPQAPIQTKAEEGMSQAKKLARESVGLPL